MSPALLPYALAAVLLLAIVIVVLLVLVLRKSEKTSEFFDATPEPEETPEETAAAPANEQTLIVSAFREAREALKTTGELDNHGRPLHLLVGAEGSRPPQFLARLAEASVQLAHTDPALQGLAFGDGCGFHLFDQGIVLDVAGEPVLAAKGESSDERAWKVILHQLRELRPRRPADGAIVTISRGELVAAQESEGGRLLLMKRAEHIHRKLSDLQRELGFRLPVYVLVTGCDELAGFDEFCSALPQSARGELLGWSNPYPPDDPFQLAWIGVGFDELHESLANLQMSLFAQKVRRDGLMLFPWALRALQEPLSNFLAPLFRSGTYREGVLARGFYFCGTYQEETAFVADLLSRKVFPESGLALPTSATRMARNRKVQMLRTATACAAVIFLVGLLIARVEFNHQNAILEPLLLDARRALRENEHSVPREAALRTLDEYAQQPAANSQTTEAVKLVTDISKIDFHRYYSVFVPSSWPVVSSFEHDLDDGIAIVFRDVVLNAVRQRIEDRIDIAIHKANTRVEELSNAPAIVAQERAVVAIEAMPEFARLQSFVSTVREAEVHAQMLARLSTPGRGDLQLLGDLVAYAFEQHLSDHFYKRGELYAKALRRMEGLHKVDPVPFQSRTSATAVQLTDDLYERAFTENPFAHRLTTLAAHLGGSATESHSSNEAEEFQQLSDMMGAIDTDLSGPELQWAFQPSFDLGRDFNGIVSAIETSKFFDPRTAGIIRGRGSAQFADFRGQLVAGTPVTGPLLATRDGRPEMKLSADAIMLRSALDAFLHQGFARQNVRGRPLPRLGDDERFVWDVPLLQRAAVTADSFDRFRDKGLKLFSPELQPVIEDAAREQIGRQLSDLLYDALPRDKVRRPDSTALLEQGIDADIRQLSAALAPIQGNLAALTRLNASRTRDDLSAAVTAEALRLLTEVDTLVTREAPYTPTYGNFAWWQGKEPASPEAWDAKDPAELAVYLDSTRSRMARVARSYAQPLLKWLVDNGTEDLSQSADLVAKWQSIVDDLADYDAKKPASAPAALEDFIADRMTKVTMKNCAEALPTSRPQRIRGYYAARLDSLSRDFQAQCWATAATEATKEYRKLARFFNQRLGGRYPFAPAVPEGNDLEADPEDVRRFFVDFDKIDKLIDSIPPAIAVDNHFPAVRVFAKEMRNVRKFFAWFLDAKTPQRLPAIDLEPQFRTLRGREHGGKEIILWKLTVGNESITDRDKAGDKPGDKARRLRWTPSQPVKLEVTWAKEAPHRPLLAEPRRGVAVADRTITYTFTNRWSLLTALNALPAEELGPGSEAEPVTLALMVELQKAAQQEEAKADAKVDDDPAQAIEPALVFLRVGLLTPEGVPLELPPKFPPRAPTLETLAAEDIR
jgi:type VI secretion system protein ImpL